MKKIFSAVIIVLAMTSSCKKEQSPTPMPEAYFIHTEHKNLNESIKPYKFKQGSYWIYKNDLTATLDSIYLDSVSSGFMITTPSTQGAPTETANEFYKMYLHSFGTSVYYNQTLFWQRYIVRNHSGNWQNGFRGQPEYVSGATVGTSKEGMAIHANFLSMPVNTYSFNDVDEVKITASAQGDYQFDHDTYLYYCDRSA